MNSIRNFLNTLINGVVWFLNGTKEHGLFIAMVTTTEIAVYFLVKTALVDTGVMISESVALTVVIAQVVSVVAVASGNMQHVGEWITLNLVSTFFVIAGALSFYPLAATSSYGEAFLCLAVGVVIFTLRLIAFTLAKTKKI